MSPTERCGEIMRLIDQALLAERAVKGGGHTHRPDEVNDGRGNSTATAPS